MGDCVLYEYETEKEKLAATLRIMAEMVKEYRRNPEIRRLAMSILQAARVPERDERGEAAAVLAWIQRNIPYRRDINQVETIMTPPELLRQGGGDCDDRTILLNSLLESIGFQTRFVLVSTIPTGYPFTHIFSQINTDGRWVSADTIYPVPLGAEPENVTARMDYEYE